MANASDPLMHPNQSMEFLDVAQIARPDTILEPTKVALEMGCTESTPRLVTCDHDSVTSFNNYDSFLHADDNKLTVQCDETRDEKPSEGKVEGLSHVKSRDSKK